ncbi:MULTISPECIES: phage tail family protein [Bacillus cereus group]|uniref:phage tail family protein n=1 Tax=Bacillus cereus group TaxID=86661 RepID=UPI0022E0224E|nr:MULTISPECIES: phage tail family protein [unclassified Bacillus cereus group]MDA2026716.1 phage tail family protein [Bacillus cereus group sp. Bcc03]MDA2713415.1 phage tail family protein [Bacillus cereus group sp. Bc025]HDR7716928.1 phage tail family protein [Bacillus albus]
MIPQTLKIIKENGKEFVIASNNDMEVLNFLPPSPFYKVQYENLDGRHGQIEIGGSFDARDNIRAQILFYSRDIWDFYLFRNEIYKLFASQDPFYIITNREPGKRWKVRVANAYEIEPKAFGQYGEFNIVFKSASSFCESIGTTMSPFTFDSNLWQIGQGLIAEDVKYTHNTTSFRIYNAGDVLIDPRNLPLKIRFIGASKNLAIKNVTTGDVWSYTGETINGSVIELNGVKSTRNGTSIFGATNWGLITLKEGWNDFVLSGAIGNFKIEFDFRFYYL